MYTYTRGMREGRRDGASVIGGGCVCVGVKVHQQMMRTRIERTCQKGEVCVGEERERYEKRG